MKEQTVAVPVITWDSIEVLDPCKESLAWAKDEFNDREQIPLDELVEILLKQRHFDWANWLATRLMDKQRCVRYAVFAARQVLPLFESQYPDDKRPAKGIHAAEEWLKSGNSAAAAAAAAYAAANAATAAYATANNAAAYAADAAADAAAARHSMRRIILNYGIQLLSKGAQ